MRRFAMFAGVAIILTGAAGCDKAKSLVSAGRAAMPPQVPATEALDLSTNPIILFQIFGERAAPRMIPVAAISGGKLESVRLDAAGWKRFDEMYLRSGRSYTLYNDGQARASVSVVRGMWEQAESIYTLPGCQVLTPIASVRITSEITKEFTVEFLASNGDLGVPRSGRLPTPAQIAAEGRRAGAKIAAASGIPRALLDSLDFHARAIHSGLSSPTIIASFIDPSVEQTRSRSGRVSHVFLIADADREGTYHVTFSHATHSSVATAEYRRFYDHLDITGDGLNEIVLEGWQFGGDTFLSVLAFRDGLWQEIYRSRSNWCLDERRR